jgi:hypothetical protein
MLGMREQRDELHGREASQRDEETERIGGLLR